ncbi:MAG: protease modulator HflC [Planctomycetota bacterium]
MRKLFWTLIIIGLLIAAWLGCTVQVAEWETVILTRFGDPHDPLEEPGLYFKLPPPIETTIRIDRRVQIQDPPSQEYLTADKKNVIVDCFLAWEVRDAIQFLKSVRNVQGARSRLNDILLAEVNTILGETQLSALITTEPGNVTMRQVNEEITQRTAAKAQENLGVRVLAAKIKRLNFPGDNKTAVFRRMEAEREKIAQEIRSQGFAEAQKIRNQTEREAAAIVSEAQSAAERIRGEADAEATRVYAEAFEKDPEFYEFLRALEAYGKMFDENTLWVIPHSSPLLEGLLRKPGAGLPKANGDD